MVFTFWFIYSDPNTKRVEEFIKADFEIKEKIGLVKDIEVRKIITKFRNSGVGQAKEPSQKLYRLIVRGEKTSAQVKLRIHFNDDDEVGDIEIEGIDL